MIFLESITVESFKGIERFSCDFDDFTVLAGLNNSGKTSVLEAIQLLIEILPGAAAHQHRFHENRDVRTVTLEPSLASLGVPDKVWVMPYGNLDADMKIAGSFSPGVTLEIASFNHGQFSFQISLPSESTSAEQANEEFLMGVAGLKAEMILPPGVVAAREDMVNGPAYRNLVKKGEGARYWRNELFWATQRAGREKFDDVCRLVKRHFPDVTIEMPVLDDNSNPPVIQIKYSERELARLDICQSGSGLRTFLTLARLLKNSEAQIVLLDEPDAHLHSSQQAVVLDLLVEAATESNKQVIIATHSPEILSRAPVECIRWVERTEPTHDIACENVVTLLEKLGAAPDAYISSDGFPDILVYVEGKTDRKFVQGLVRWCQSRTEGSLPRSLVLEHKNGRFNKESLYSLVRFGRQLNPTIRVVGIRDLDWQYGKSVDCRPIMEDGDGFILLTLPCKELENLLCDARLLHDLFLEQVPVTVLQEALEKESLDPVLVSEWQCNVLPQIRKRLSNGLDETSKERQALDSFEQWKSDPSTRARLVAGKELLKRVRAAIRDDYPDLPYPLYTVDRAKKLTKDIMEIVKAIYPNVEFSADT